jgi:hypothetical protein
MPAKATNRKISGALLQETLTGQSVLPQVDTALGLSDERRLLLRSVAEYLYLAADFEKLAADAEQPSLRRRYADVAACYRLLAAQRERLITQGCDIPTLSQP